MIYNNKKITKIIMLNILIDHKMEDNLTNINNISNNRKSNNKSNNNNSHSSNIKL